MSGYATTARIDRSTVRVKAFESVDDGPPPARMDILGDVEPYDLAGAMGERLEELRERLSDLRTGLDQMTFFLLDPDSWRR